MTDNLHDTIKSIKQRLRLSMNGIVSTLQRRQGLDYKINFGVEIPRLKSIAQEYRKDPELAAALWRDNIRECKLLAIFLMPQEEYEAVAERWVAETPFTEIADHLAMTILCQLPAAGERAIKWIGQEDTMARYCGYLTLTHITKKGGELPPECEEKLYRAAAELFASDADTLLARTAFTTLCHCIDADPSKAYAICAAAGPESKLAKMVADYII